MNKLIIISMVLFNIGCGTDSGVQSSPPIPAQPCTVTQTNVSTIITCPNGSTATIPNESLTIVQFCPGTPTYPSLFPEVGFCINNNIYAVYSANDGFMTEIIPGYYNSNAIGSNCNFTVKSNCVIINQ